MSIHLGKLISAKLKEKRISKSEFARMINKSRQNVQDILKRESLDTHLLKQISKALDYNFFELFTKNTPDKVLLSQLREAQKEIEYLKKINSLLEKKK
jgi:transcriptional regulator with XRE-family HTH domain